MSKILHFKLDDIINNDQITDLSGNGYDGTIQGGVTVVNDDTFGTCLEFNGSDGIITINAAGNTALKPVFIDHSFTVSAWVNLYSINGHKTILGNDTPGANNCLVLLVRDGNPSLAFYSNDTDHTTLLNTNQWYHITWVYDYDENTSTGSQIMYINGSDRVESDQPKNSLKSTSQLNVGTWGNGNFFHGKLYGLRVYNSVLTQAGIQSIIHEDRDWTISRTAHPIDFDLYDKDTQNVLYIEDASDQLLTLHIENAAAETIQLPKLNGDISESNYHFALRFRPGTLSPVSLEDSPNGIQLATETTSNWEMTAPQTDTSGMDVIYLRSKADNFSLNPGDRQTLVFNNVGANGDQGARGTRVELLYTNMHYSGGTETVTGNREIHMSVINHRGKQNIPLHVGFVGDNGVLNDGATQNALTLRLSNTLVHNTLNADTSSLTFSHNADTTLRSKIILSFDAGTATDEWALATEAQIRNITISPLTGWTIIEPVQGESPEWILYPDTEDQVLHGRYAPDPNNANAFLPDYFELQIGTIDPGTGDITNGIVTGFPTGHTHLHIRYENIPGYWDGQLKVAIEKRPLHYNGGNVGIGTSNPSEKLHIMESGQLATLRIEPEDWTGHPSGVMVRFGPGDIPYMAGSSFGAIQFGVLSDFAIYANSFNSIGDTFTLTLGTNGRYIRTEWGEGMTIHDGEKVTFTGGNVGIGSTSTDAKFNVDGVVHIQDEKPFMIKRYSNIGDNPTYNTNMSIATYNAVIAGFDTGQGNFTVTGDVSPLKIYMETNQDGNWRIRADLRSHDPLHENWTVDVMFIRKELSDCDYNI